ncbi:MAG: hypothetical protein Q8M83_06280 [bacterium]|nr:hypothetical protein [bacterium]
MGENQHGKPLEAMSEHELQDYLADLQHQRQEALGKLEFDKADNILRAIQVVMDAQLQKRQAVLREQQEAKPATEVFAGFVAHVAEANDTTPPERPITVERKFFTGGGADANLQSLPKLHEVLADMTGLPVNSGPGQYQELRATLNENGQRRPVPPPSDAKPAPVVAPQPAVPPPAQPKPPALPASLPVVVAAVSDDDLAQAGLKSGGWRKENWILAVSAIGLLIGAIVWILIMGEDSPTTDQDEETIAAAAPQTSLPSENETEPTVQAEDAVEPINSSTQPVPVAAQETATPLVAQATPVVVAQTQTAASPTEQAVAVVSPNPVVVANAETSPASPTEQVLPEGVMQEQVDGCVKQVLDSQSKANKYPDLRQRCIGSLAGL